MKRMLVTASVTLSVMLLAAFQNTTSAQPRTDVTIDYQTFYDELDPYGQWMDYPDQGYVWVPDAGPDFQPYSTSGHWVWSDDYEWIWVSDYDWGWAPFHYGRWLHDPRYGWMWVPGYEWSPAWVAWRDGGDYYGWAPLRPGINISINFSLGGYNPPIDYWCFTPRRYITSHNLYNYCAPRRNNITIINQTTIINNYNYNRNIFRTGPGRRDAERYAGRINPVRFRDASAPGRTSFRNNEVSAYRPRVQRDDSRTYAPRRFERANTNGTNNGNAIRRNENGNRSSENGNRNNLPRRERTINRPERNNDRQPGNNNEIAGGRRDVINRNRNTDGQPGGNRRFERPDNNTNRPDINRPENNTRPNRENREARPFTRPNMDRPQRNIERPQRNIERPQTPNQNNDRRVERRDNMQRNNNVPRPERRQMGNESRPQQQPRPQMEQRRQEQPRQFQQRNESRSSENRGGGRRER